MRVLYLSRADAFDDTSSAVIVAKSVIRHMLEADPELYVTWVIPERTSEDLLDEYVRRFLGENAKRLGFLKCMAGLGGRTLGYFLTQDVWYAMSQTKVDVPYDVVLSNQPALTCIWHALLANRYKASRFNVKVPIVNWQWWIATEFQVKLVPEYWAGEPDLVAETLSSSFARNAFESKFLMEQHLATARKYLQPALVQKIKENSVVVHDGVALDQIYEQREKRAVRLRAGGKPCLLWGGRLANQKKPQITFPLMAQVQNASRCDVRISTNSPESHDNVDWVRESWPHWLLFTGQARHDWFGHLAFGDVFLSNSPSETYGIAWMEMLAVGMLGVYEKAWWVEALMPDWYPFVAESAEEQVMMATALLKDWPDGPLWKTYVPRVLEWIQNEHDELLCAETMLRVLHEERAKAMEEDVGKGTGSMGRLVVKAAEDALEVVGAPIPEQQIWGRMTDLSDSGREFGAGGDIVSRMYLRRCLELNGWRDLADARDVVFVPPGWPHG